MASNHGRQSPSPPHDDDAPRVPSSSIPTPLRRPSALQASRVFEGAVPEHPPAVSPSVPGALSDPYTHSIHSPASTTTRSSLISIPVPPPHPIRIGVETSAPTTSFVSGPRHPSLRAASPPRVSPEDDHGSTTFLAHSSAPPPPPPAHTKREYNPRGDFDQPGPSTYPRISAQSPFLPPDAVIAARVRSHHTSRSRVVSGVEGNGESSPRSGVRTLQPPREKNVAERLEQTLQDANKELTEAKLRAKTTGWSLNIAIGAQVALGAFTTGIAAATHGHATSIATSILGGLSTLAASYLAKSRGSGEPEASTVRCRDLEHFMRDCNAFVLDKGHLSGDEFDGMINGFRRRLEEVLGNTGGAVADKVQGRERLQSRDMSKEKNRDSLV